MGAVDVEHALACAIYCTECVGIVMSRLVEHSERVCSLQT